MDLYSTESKQIRQMNMFQCASKGLTEDSALIIIHPTPDISTVLYFFYSMPINSIDYRAFDKTEAKSLLCL